MNNKIFWILVALVVLSVATSELHRYFVSDAKLDIHWPTITDGVIPAIAPKS